MKFIIDLLILILVLFKRIDAYPKEEFNPDAYFYGFLPFWGVFLLILSSIFLVIAIFGLIGYYLGLRTPLERHPPSIDSTALFFISKKFSTMV